MLPQDQSLYLTVGAREPQSPDTLTSSTNQPLPLLVWAQNKGKATGDMLPARPGIPPYQNKRPANHMGTLTELVGPHFHAMSFRVCGFLLTLQKTHFYSAP